MERYVPEPRRRKRMQAAFLAFIFGIFGVHKFYLNNKGGGVFYIMLFVMTINMFGFPLSMLLGFMDAMKLLMLSDEEFDHKYNKQSVRTGQRYGRERRRQRKEQPDFRRTSRRQPVAKKRKSSSSGLRKENAYVKTGIKHYKEFDLEEAIVDFNKGLEIDPENVALHFNIACAYSLMENKDKAFSHLSKAVAYGLKDANKIQTHEDLAFVRIQPEYEAFKENGYRHTRKTSQSTSDTTAKPEVKDELLNRLNKLAELRKRGLLSEKEFAMEKQKLMR